MRISAVVMTLNEERNIEFCLRSLRSWCDEIVVVDMFSEDATTQIAARYADVVLTHERLASFDLGRERGVEAASGDWILSIDADEVVTPALARWIRQFVDSPSSYDLALIPRVNVFLGRRLHSTPWWPGKPRLFRAGAVKVTGDLHHGLVPTSKRVARLPRKSELSIWHFSRLDLEQLSAKTNSYSSTLARQAIAAGRGDPSWTEVFASPLRELGKYVLRRGYRDGRSGLAYVVDRAHYRFMTQVKRWDETQKPTRQARYDEWRESILRGFPDGGRMKQS